MSRLPILGTAYAHGRTEVTARTAKNIWFEPRGADEKAPVLASHLPKRTTYSFSETITAPFAFVRSDRGITYLASTTKLYSIVPGSGILAFSNTFPSALTSTSRLDFASDDTTIVMAQFGRAFHCGINGGTITAIDIEGQTPVSVTWLRGYFVILCWSGRLYWSATGTTWDALDFANAEASCDDGTKIMAVGNVLVIFGHRSIEFWAPTDNADIPFAPITDTVIKTGILASSWACLIDGQPFFWGSPSDGPRGLFALEGSNLKRITTPDMERVITGTSIWVSGFSLLGHLVVAIKTNASTDTYWIDVSTGALTVIPDSSPFSGQVEYANYQGGVYGVEPTASRHFKLDPTDYDTTVARELVTDNISSPDLDRFAVNKIRLDVAGSQDISFECSRDGGATWGSVRTVSASSGEGVKGTATLDRYGTATQFTFRLKATGKLVLSNMMINPRN